MLRATLVPRVARNMERGRHANKETALRAALLTSAAPFLPSGGEGAAPPPPGKKLYGGIPPGGLGLRTTAPYSQAVHGSTFDPASQVSLFERILTMTDQETTKMFAMLQGLERRMDAIEGGTDALRDQLADTLDERLTSINDTLGDKLSIIAKAIYSTNRP